MRNSAQTGSGLRYSLSFFEKRKAGGTRQNDLATNSKKLTVSLFFLLAIQSYASTIIGIVFLSYLFFARVKAMKILSSFCLKSFSLALLVVCLLSSSLFAKTNVILMIVDGGGEGAYRMGSQYMTGEDRGMFYMNPANGWVELGCTTYSLSGVIEQLVVAEDGSTSKTTMYSRDGAYNPATHWKTFDKHFANPTDSAASATALNTGVKTKNGRLCVDKDGKSLETIAEFAAQRGFAAGAITNVMPSHATPAAVAAHSLSRGAGIELFKQMVEGDTLSVIIGAVHPWFDRNGQKLDKPKFNEYGPSEELWSELLKGNAPNGWTYIEKREDFQKFANDPASAPDKLLGIAQVAMTFQSSRSHKYPERLDNIPTMKEACMAGINTLAKNDKGFYLMIESGAVDWISEPQRICEEMVEFNDAVKAICDWVEKNSSWEETTLILTADHETHAVFGPEADKPETLFQAPIGQGKGNVPQVKCWQNNHTNAPVPLFVKGAGAKKLEKSVRVTDETFGKIWGFDGRIIDNTDIAPAARELFEGK